MARSRKNPSLLLVLLLALGVAALGAVSLARRVADFQPLGFTAVPAAGHWRVTQVTSTGSSLAPGDEILLVDGESFAREASLRRALRQRPATELLILRHGELERVSYRLPPLEVDLPYLVLALIGVGYLVIGLFTLLKDRRSPALLFYLWCVASAAVYILSPAPPLDALGRATYLVEELARVVLPPLTLHLFLLFPRPALLRERLHRYLPFLYLPAAVLLTLQGDLAFFGGRYLFAGRIDAPTLRRLDHLELYQLALFSLAAIGVLAVRFRRTAEWESRRQVAWIVVGLAGGYLPFLGLYVLPLALGLRGPELLATIAVVPLALVPLTFAYAILRYKLWDIGVIVRDTISLTLTLLIGVVGFSLANLVISRSVPTADLLARNLLAFLAGLAIAGVLVPTKRGISHSLERLQYGAGYRKRRELAAFGRRLLHERDLDRLAADLLDQLERSLELSRANLLLAQGVSLVPVRPHRLLPSQIPLAALGEDFWERDMSPLSGVALPASDAPLPQRLVAAGYRYAFPLSVRDHPVGAVLTGFKHPDEPLNSDDVELVRSLLNQVVLAIENAQLLDQVQRQLDEVVRLKRHNEGIIESTPAGIAVLDADNRIVSANLAFAALAGVERREAIGRPLAELLPIQPLPQPGEGILTVSFCDAEGAEHHLQISLADLQEGGDHRNLVLVVQDISERVAMETAMKDQERLASLGVLAAGVAHEVNTPITGISSYAQMLIAGTDPDDPRYELLKKVERQTFRASRIVNNLLELARSRDEDFAEIDLGPVLDDTLELLRERMRESGIELRWTPPGSPVVVRANDGELQQVFTNLALNAIEAMRSGGVLRVAVDGAQRSLARITFEDDGPGISVERQRKIFEPFYSTKVARGGTGLGLAISVEILHRHGGELKVESELGHGSRFVVELPRPDAGS